MAEGWPGGPQVAAQRKVSGGTVITPAELIGQSLNVCTLPFHEWAQQDGSMNE